MPTYEYECAKCKRVFEEFQSITAEPLKKCTFEGCDGSVKRLMSGGAGFLFKGSGFYETDYRSDSYKQKAKADTGAAGSSGSMGTSGATGGAAAKDAPKTPSAPASTGSSSSSSSTSSSTSTPSQ